MGVERDENGYTLPERERSKSASLKDGAFWAVMVGAGESYINPFAIRLGADAGFSGLLQTVPQFLGALSQLAALPLESRIRNRPLLLGLGVLAQALVWLPLALLAWWVGSGALGEPGLSFQPPALVLPAILLFYCLYQVFGQIVNPVWSAWMAELVLPGERGAYFASRSRLTVLVQLLTVLASGVVLDHAGLPAVQSFVLLFLGAFAARALSGWYLSRMSDARQEIRPAASPAPPASSPPADWSTFLSSPGLAENRRFTLYIGAIMAATYIASPFFDIFMLAVLGLDYTTWSLLVASQTLAKFFFFPYWGRAIDRFGNRAVLFGTGFLIPAVALLWVFDHSFWWLLPAQVFSGLAWSGFELASFNYTLSNSDRATRTAQSAAYNFAKGSGSLAGMLLGAGLLAAWPRAGPADAGPFLAVFFISAMARYIASAYFLPRFSERTFEGGMTGNKFLWEVLAATPSRRMGRHLMYISEHSLHLAQTEADRTARAARQLGEVSKAGLRLAEEGVVRSVRAGRALGEAGMGASLRTARSLGGSVPRAGRGLARGLERVQSELDELARDLRRARRRRK